MTKTDIGIYRGLKEKFDPEVHIGFFITTDTGELLVGDQSLGLTISGWEINDGVLTLRLNTGRDIRVTFPEATETAKGLLSASDKAALNTLASDLNNKVDKVTGKSLIADSEIEKLAGLPNSTELTNSVANAKAAGDNAQSDLNAHKQNTSNPHSVTKEQVGLGNVTNDALVKRSEMGVANGVATLDSTGKVPSSQLPSFVDDIVDVYATYQKSSTGVLSNIVLYSDAAKTKVVTGEAGKIYQNITTGEPTYQFRWTGTVFAQTGASSLILGIVEGTAYDGAEGKANADNIAKVKGTSLTHIKDADPITTTADKVSLNYECYAGEQYGAAGTAHTADIPAATTTKAGVMSAADKTKLENLNSKLVVADEEDVTAVDGKIKFKDRDTSNGMGYKILRLPEDGILTQEMINESNTIYEIRYDFDLNGTTITVPENSILDFQGGSFSNGTIEGNNTVVSNNLNKVCFTRSIILTGTFKSNGITKSEWFDFIDDAIIENNHVTTCTNNYQQFLNICKFDNIVLRKGCYGVDLIDSISINHSIKFNGGNATICVKSFTNKYKSCIDLKGSENEKIIIDFKNLNILGNKLISSDITEWVHGLNLSYVTGKVSNVNSSFNRGDGLYIEQSYNVVIENCIFTENHRNNLSITDEVHYININNCTFNHANGTAPEAGIDIEPNRDESSSAHKKSATNIIISNCNFNEDRIDLVGLDVDKVKNIKIVNCNIANKQIRLYNCKDIQIRDVNIKTQLDTGIFFSNTIHDNINISNVSIIKTNIDKEHNSYGIHFVNGDSNKTSYTNISFDNIYIESFKIGILEESSENMICDNIKYSNILCSYCRVAVEIFSKGVAKNHSYFNIKAANLGKYSDNTDIEGVHTLVVLEDDEKTRVYIIDTISGTKSERPAYKKTGSEYFDTTLNKPVWWNGTEWVDPVADATAWKLIR